MEHGQAFRYCHSASEPSGLSVSTATPNLIPLSVPGLMHILGIGNTSQGIIQRDRELLTQALDLARRIGDQDTLVAGCWLYSFI